MKKRVDDFVLGSMTPDDRAAMELARRFDPELDQHIKDAEDSLAPLSLAAGEIAPRPDLWSRIEAAIDSEAGALEGRTIIELEKGDWQPVVPGIEMKTMWDDRTSLLRCAPGAVLPDHSHDGDEHLLVLSGDLIIGGRTFLAGDYIGNRAGYDGVPHTTRTGCMILSQIVQ
jgi:mannose-6-phosphate isomerase-like protein (cupin superfamily)